MDVNSNQVTEIIDGVLHRLAQYSPDDLFPDPGYTYIEEAQPLGPAPRTSPLSSEEIHLLTCVQHSYREREIPPNKPSTWSSEECLKWLQIDDGNANS